MIQEGLVYENVVFNQQVKHEQLHAEDGVNTSKNTFERMETVLITKAPGDL